MTSLSSIDNGGSDEQRDLKGKEECRPTSGLQQP
jgi:hypothetical protein